MRGFSLIELLVVLGISAMLASIALVYTGIGRNQTALSVETAKIAGFIFRANELSLATYAKPSSPGAPRVCGYGVVLSISNNDYSLFAYEPNPANYPSIPVSNGVLQSCPTEGEVVTTGIDPASEEAPASPSDWNVPLANGVQMISGGQGDDLLTVLFYPPKPDVLLSNNGTNFSNIISHVYLQTSGATASTTITVNSAGQVSF